MKKNIFLYFLFFCFLLFIIYSISIFFIGIHNIDLGQNIMVLNEKYNLNVVDYASDDNLYSGMELYRIGLRQIKKAFFVFGFFDYLLGLIYFENY